MMASAKIVKPKSIIHEQFLGCRKFTTDTYWHDIIYSCACNKFPRGVKYDTLKNTIYVRFEVSRGKSKGDVFLVPEEDKDIYTLFMHIFRDILGLRSDKDISSSKQELEDIRKCSEIDLEVDWKKLKPRSMKNQILMNFAMTQIKENDLDPKTVKHLYNTIQLGFQFKSLSSDDVMYEKGIVTGINGLEFDPETNKFIITNLSKPLTRTDKPAARTNKLIQTIDKWTRDHKTYYNIQG